MKAFFDHNIEPHIARAINEAVVPRGDEARAKRDKFPINTADVDWLRQLGAEGNWIVFTFDQRILRNPVERAALYDSRLTTFFFRPAVQKQTALQRTATLLWHWDGIASFVARQERGLYWLPVNKGTKFEQIRI